jgi:predicted 3-demethylubiquinone-9 3-methyltransferase (glyoxalase superfamily)
MAKLTTTITTFLTYQDRAEEAVQLYVSLFENSKVLSTTRYGAGGPGPSGSVMTMEFELAGQRYVALNGGPHFKFSDGVSLAIACETQEEIDRISAGLCEGGGEQGPCGWLKDRFGLSWQVTPRVLPKLLGDPDPVKSRRVMEAMMKMKKFDIATLERAHRG